MKSGAYDGWSDEELVASYQSSGDEDVFEILWQRHWAQVYSQCRAFVGDAAAEDITARTFVQAWRQLGKYRSGNFVAWLTVIARNCCINHVQSAWSRLVTTAGDEIIAVSDGIVGRGGPQEDPEFSNELEHLVNELPDQQRTALKLFYLEGYSYAQIAGIMQCDTEQVKSHLQNAKRKLRILWKESNPAVGEGIGK